MKKILICGGHLTPALALINELKSDNVQIIFVGRKYSVEGSKNFSTEYREITGKKIRFMTLTTGRFQRHFTRYTIPSLLKIPIGFVQSFYYLILTRPNIVISFGGYISTPIVFSAWLLGIPAITHEQATRIGLANKINSIFVKEFLSAWPITNAEVKREVKCIGNLTRSDIFSTKVKNKRFNKFLDSKKRIIYITGGSLGSHFINDVIFKSIDLLANFNIVHQIGPTDFKGDHEKARKINTNNYLPVTYIPNEEIGGVLNYAYLVISRSGANTIWELAVLKKIAILIPLPFSGSKEQQANASILKEAGSALVIPQKEFNPQTLQDAISNINANYNKFKNNAIKLSKTINLDAAAKMRQIILKYLVND